MRLQRHYIQGARYAIMETVQYPNGEGLELVSAHKTKKQADKRLSDIHQYYGKEREYAVWKIQSDGTVN